MKSHNKIPFEKYHGNGNDFIFMEESVLATLQSIDELREFVKKLCSVHFSIGADGVVFYKISHADDTRVLIVNSDGSFASTCGNALRCVGLKLLQEDLWDGSKAVDVARLIPSLFLKQRDHFELDEQFILNPDSFATLLCENKGKNAISVVMGVEKQAVPTPLRENSLSQFGQDMDFLTPIYVELANHHWVFVSPLFKSFKPEDFRAFGTFAQGELRKKNLTDVDIPLSNISMVSLEPKGSLDWHVSVFERGAGLTQCCGSGALATHIALESIGLISKEMGDVFFHMPGGVIRIYRKTMDGTSKWILAGDAVCVFEGFL